MNPINVMINGLPGNVTKVIARQAVAASSVSVLPWSLTGPEIEAPSFRLDDRDFQLVKPQDRDRVIEKVIAEHKAFISVDFTHPSAVNDNAEFYCRHNLPFVMGTTGGDRNKLEKTVRASATAAVIAPNMAKQIVGFQAMMAHAAETFPNLFRGYRLVVRESHQSGKADTSGTAKAMVTYFNKMGVPFKADDIEKERDPERQTNMWGVPVAYLSGHAWHTYTLISADDTVKFEFTHNVNGRDIYGEGTLDAIAFLQRELDKGAKGTIFSMIDVLKAG